MNSWIGRKNIGIIIHPQTSLIKWGNIIFQLSFTAHSKYWQTPVCCLSVVYPIDHNVFECRWTVYECVTSCKNIFVLGFKVLMAACTAPNKTLLHLKGPNIHRHFFNSQRLGMIFFPLWLGNCPVYFCHFRNTSSILCRVQNQHFPSDKCLPTPFLLFYQTQVMWMTKMPF